MILGWGRLDSYLCCSDQGDTDFQKSVKKLNEASPIFAIRSKENWMEDILGLRTLNENPLRAALLLVSVAGNAEPFFFFWNCNRIMFTLYTVNTNRQAASSSQPRIEWSGYTQNNTKDILADLCSRGSVSTAFLFQTNTKRNTILNIHNDPGESLEWQGTKVKGRLLGSWGCITLIVIHRATLMVNPRFSACWCWQCVSCHWDQVKVWPTVDEWLHQWSLPISATQELMLPSWLTWWHIFLQSAQKDKRNVKS